MENIDKILENNKIANEAFKVPEGYFDTLTERIMENIPQEQKKAQVISIRTKRMWRWAAACVCMLIVGASSFLYINKTNNSSVDMASYYNTAVTQDVDDIEQAANYVMMDNQDMYQMLAEE